ncbi:MAG: hypothetical protein ABIH46_04515 [Chloroflexota bacterium]
MEQRIPTTWYLWISRLAGVAGMILLVLAGVAGMTASTVFAAAPSTLILAAIAAFLFAIWSVLYELRDHGIRTRH